MTTLVLLEATAQPGRTQDLAAFFKHNFHHSQGHDGFREAAAYIGEDGSTVIVTQVWDSKSDFEKYLAWRETAGSVGEFQALSQGQPVVRFFELQ